MRKCARTQRLRNDRLFSNFFLFIYILHIHIYIFFNFYFVNRCAWHLVQSSCSHYEPTKKFTQVAATKKVKCATVIRRIITKIETKNSIKFFLLLLIFGIHCFYIFIWYRWYCQARLTRQRWHTNWLAAEGGQGTWVLKRLCLISVCVWRRASRWLTNCKSNDNYTYTSAGITHKYWDNKVAKKVEYFLMKFYAKHFFFYSKVTYNMFW